MRDTIDGDYTHTKRVCKDFKVKNLEWHYDLYVQSDALFLAEVFEKFLNMCLETYELDPACFLTTPALVKIQDKIKSFNWYQYAINGRKRYQWRNVKWWNFFKKCIDLISLFWQNRVLTSLKGTAEIHF